MEAELFYNNHRMLSFQSVETNRSSRIEQSVPDVSPLMPQRISGILHLDPVPELKHDTGLAMFWSPEEQLLLADGLSKNAQEPKITKYVRIASMLKNKTVRDVAFRCRWMTNESRRRRKQDHNSKMKDNKVKHVESPQEGSSGAANWPLIAPSHSFATYHPDSSANGASFKASCVSYPMQHLLDENALVLLQIRDNLDVLKVQENIHLLLHANNNLTSVLDRMSKVPGLSQMNPLPIAVDENLFSKFLLLSHQVSKLTRGKNPGSEEVGGYYSVNGQIFWELPPLQSIDEEALNAHQSGI